MGQSWMGLLSTLSAFGAVAIYYAIVIPRPEARRLLRSTRRPR